MKLQTNYSGAMQVATMEESQQYSKYLESLDEVFRREAVLNTDMAWYVDHFSEDVGKFNVRQFAVDPLLSWTNEVISQRDPDDPIESQWGAEDVVSWFTDSKGAVHVYVVKFQAGGEEHRLTLRPYSASLDDRIELWNEYVDQGVRGAMERFQGDFERLIAIEHYIL